MVTARIAQLCLLLGAFGCATAGPHRAAPEEVHLLDGDVVPWPSLVPAEGGTVVVFATPWCEICRRERPEVEAWARAHRESRRTVYVFSGGELPQVADQIRALHLDSALTVVVDADGRLADRYGVRSTPTVLVLGAPDKVLATSHRFQAAHLD